MPPTAGTSAQLSNTTAAQLSKMSPWTLHQTTSTRLTDSEASCCPRKPPSKQNYLHVTVNPSKARRRRNKNWKPRHPLSKSQRLPTRWRTRMYQMICPHSSPPTVGYFAGAVINPDTGKSLEYQDLIKNEKYRDFGRDRVDYPFDVSTPTADLITSKLLFNSVISTEGAEFMTADIKNFNLNTHSTAMNTCNFGTKSASRFVSQQTSHQAAQ